MNQAHVPAVALAVVNKQEILYTRGFGLTSVEEGGATVSPRTLFRIGSVTKPLVGTAVMRLVENGQLWINLLKHTLNGFALASRMLRSGLPCECSRATLPGLLLTLVAVLAILMASIAMYVNAFLTTYLLPLLADCTPTRMLALVSLVTLLRL